MLLSFIIPAYNVEKYIVACLDSCLAQGIDDMEVIVVDDGSTDDTPALLHEYAQQHPCVKVFHQKNQGQSVARNLAIEKATGEYIYMVDSDDKMMEGKVLPIDTMQSGKYDIIGVQVMYRLEDGTQRPWSHQMERWPFASAAYSPDIPNCASRPASITRTRNLSSNYSRWQGLWSISAATPIYIMSIRAAASTRAPKHASAN